MGEIKMWFLYGYNGFKSHAKDKDLVDLVMYLHCEPDGTFRQFYDSDSNWRLILSENNCWIWKTDIQELMTVPIEKLIFMPKRRYIRYKYFSSIEKKYLKVPYTLDEITKCLEFSNRKNKEKVKNIIKNSGAINFYITLWIQNSIR